jgi:spermidine/putrescine transport system permease protein
VRRAAAALWLAAMAGFIALPVGVLVLFSFQDGRLPVPPFRGFTLRWHAEVLGDRRLAAALGNSLLVALASSAVALALGFLAARGLAGVTGRRAGLTRGLIVAPLAVSTLVIGLGLLAAFDLLGVPRSLWTVGAGHVVLNAPLCFAICAAAIGAREIAAERAARDLGASEWAVMTRVTAPMIAPSLAAAYLLSVTFSWDEFVIAFLLSRFDVTLPVEIWSLLRSGLNPRTNAAGSLVFLASIAVVALAEIALRGRRR